MENNVEDNVIRDINDLLSQEDINKAISDYRKYCNKIELTIKKTEYELIYIDISSKLLFEMKNYIESLDKNTRFKLRPAISNLISKGMFPESFL